ncbi:MAG: RES family NAD+ phosphorylase [bacterium]|nr:RES family NAD+ phosphorylase [bacterium]
MSLRTIERGGRYLRVADPDWRDPLDGSHSERHGGRWNPPGSFPVVYLGASLAVARVNVRRKFAGLPYGPEDVEPDVAPVLVTTDITTGDFVDVVSDEGCRAAGLPESYPRDEGEDVVWERCQPIGQRAWDESFPGIACRSAAPGAGSDDEELAWFQRDRILEAAETMSFEDWFWPT